MEIGWNLNLGILNLAEIREELLLTPDKCPAICCIGGCAWSWGRAGLQPQVLAPVTVKWLQQSFLPGNAHGSCGPGMLGMLA